MNGIKYLLDTNALIALLNGNSSLDNLLVEADWIATSVINVIEFLSFSHLNETNKKVFYEFINRITIILLSYKDRNLFEAIAKIRTLTHLKLPDAIIAGTAIYNNAVLLSNDKGFTKISSLQIAVF